MRIELDMMRPTFSADDLERLASRIQPSEVITDAAADKGEVSTTDTVSQPNSTKTE
jgi:hypothetical protein